MCPWTKKYIKRLSEKRKALIKIENAIIINSLFIRVCGLFSICSKCFLFVAFQCLVQHERSAPTSKNAKNIFFMWLSQTESGRAKMLAALPASISYNLFKPVAGNLG